MLNTLKTPFVKLYSYFRPVKLGCHISTDSVSTDTTLKIDDLISTCVDFNKSGIKDTRANKSESITFEQPIKVNLKSNSEFELLSINISKSNESKNLVRVKDKRSKQVFRISMNTFRALFTLEDN